MARMVFCKNGKFLCLLFCPCVNLGDGMWESDVFDLKGKQKSWFWGYVPRDNKNEPCATKIKNITTVVYSEWVLKVGDSGHFSG